MDRTGLYEHRLMPAPLIYDGFTTAIRGMNDGLGGSLLPQSQYQLGVNVTSRGGFIQQRPGFRRIMRVLDPGFFQHGGWLRTRDGRTFLVAVQEGRFYRVDPIQKTVLEFTIPGDRNPSTLTMGWSIPGGAEGFWIYQDNQTLPLIWNGSSARRAGPKEIKTGNVISYVQGRIWYARPDGISFRAGDLVGSRDTGTAAYDFKDSILSETENTFLNEGGDFTVPSDSGGIRAMVATALLDTSQGQGPLQVFCVKSASSVNTPVDRTIWKAVQYPILTTSLLSAGASGAQSTNHVNGDIFMRSTDGIRSFIVARRYFRDWGNTPQSFEVSNLLKFDQDSLLIYGSGAVFDNRFFTTISPAWSQGGVYHRGLVAMDLSPVSSILSQGTPVYDGLWTGLNILNIQQTDAGTYLFVLAADGSVDLWELSKEDLYDDDGTGRISWSVVPRRMFVEVDAAGRPQWRFKKLETADLFYDKLSGTVDFTMFWKPDLYPCWTTWKQWQECAPTCELTPGCTPGQSFQTQYQPRFRLPEPPDGCEVGIKSPLRNFYETDMRLDVVGPARLRGVRLGVTVQGEPVYDPNCASPACVPIRCCEFDPFLYVARGTEGSPSYYGGGGGSGSPGYPYPVPEGVPTAPPTGGSTAPPDNTGVEPPENPPGTPPDSPPGTPPTVTFGPVWPPQELPPGAQSFQPLFADPDNPSPERPLGYEPVGDPPSELGDGILEQWKNAVLEKWEDYKVANGLNPGFQQLVWKYSPGDGQLRYNPNLVFGSGVYAKAAWHFEIWIYFST